jgi:hypothetical protein
MFKSQNVTDKKKDITDVILDGMDYHQTINFLITYNLANGFSKTRSDAYGRALMDATDEQAVRHAVNSTFYLGPVFVG